MPTDPSNPSVPTPEPASDGRPLWQTALRVLGWLVGGLVMLLLLVALALQSSTVGRAGLRWVLASFNPFDNAQVQFDRLSGNPFTGLRLYDVNVIQADSIRLAHVDTLSVRYRLWPLIARRELRIREVTLAGPIVEMTQRADSTWDLLQILPVDTTAASNPIPLYLDEADVRRGDLTLHFYAAGRDSSLRVEDLFLGLDDLEQTDGLTLDLDTLRAQVQLTGAPKTALRLGGTLADNRIDLRGLSVQSDRTDLTGHGSLYLPFGTDSTAAPVNYDGTDLRLRAAPLAFADLHPFVPALDAETQLTADLHVEGTDGLVRIAAAGAFAQGGQFDLTATGTPRLEGDLQYRLQGDLAALDLNRIAGLDAQLSGRIDLALEGPTLGTLDGTADLALTQSRFAEYAFEATTLQARFTDGTARLNLNTGLRRARLTIEGTLRPFDDLISYDLQGRVRSLDLARFVEGGTQQSDLNATFAIAGRGLNGDEADTRVRLDLGRSSLNRQTINSARLAATLRNRVLGFDASVVLPEGGLGLKGTGRLTEGDLTYTIGQGELDRLDVAALTGDTTRSSLTGTFTAEGRGLDPQTMRLQANAALQDSRYGTYHLQAGTLAATLRQGTLQLDTDATLNAGRLILAATVHPFRTTPTATITQGQLQNFDLGTFLGRDDQQSDLNGTFTAALTGFDPATMKLQATLDLSESRLNQQAIKAAQVQATLDDGLLRYDLALDVPQGRTTLAGSLRPFDETLTYRVDQGAFQALNLGALLGRPNLQSDLNGTLQLEGRGFDPETMNLLATLKLDPSRFNDERLTDGTLQLTLQGGQAAVDATIDFAQGRSTIKATADLTAEQPTYQAEGILTNLDLGRLLGTDTLATRLTGTFNVDGAGFDPNTMTLNAAIDATELTYQDLRADTLQARFSLTQGTLQVTSLKLRSNLANLDASGPIGLSDSLGTTASNFTFDLQAGEIGVLKNMLGLQALVVGEGRVQGRIFGRPGQFRLDIRADVGNVLYNDIRIAGLKGRFVGEFDQQRNLQAAELEARVDHFSVPAFGLESADLDLTYDDTVLRFVSDLVVDGRRDARLSGFIDLDPNLRRLTVEDLNLRLDDRRWTLSQPTEIYYGEQYRVRNLLLATTDQQLALDGVIDFNGEQNMVLTVENFRLGAVADLFDLYGLDGTLDGTLDLTGPAYAPQLDGTLNLALLAYKQPIDIDATLHYEDLSLQLDAQFKHRQTDGSLLLEGSVPMNLRLNAPADSTGAVQIDATPPQSEVDLTLLAESFSISWLRSFFDPTFIDRLEGRLLADVEITGTFGDPSMNGEAFLDRGLLRMPEFGVTYSDIEIEATLDDDIVEVHHIELNSGGSMIGHGTIHLPELTLGEIDIAASAENFLAIDSDEYTVVTAADLTLGGTTLAPVLRGTAQVREADIRLTDKASSDDFEPVRLTEADERMLAQRFGIRLSEEDTTSFDFYEAMTIENLTVSLERDVWLRSKDSPKMDIQFTGDLDLQKQPFGEEQAFGSIDVLSERSRIEQFGKKFAIERGTVTFNGPVTDPVMDIRAAYRVPSRRAGQEEVVIELVVGGRLEDLDFELQSDPQMETADILSYLALGRPASEALQFSGGAGSSLLDPATGLVISQVTHLLENLAGSELGLDVIEIDYAGTQGATFTVGKYVSPKLYVSISQPISFNGGGGQGNDSDPISTLVTLEYEIVHWLLLQLAREGANIEVNFQWDYAY